LLTIHPSKSGLHPTGRPKASTRHQAMQTAYKDEQPHNWRPSASQKATFCTLKGHLSEAKRRHIGKPLAIRQLQRHYKPCCERRPKTLPTYNCGMENRRLTASRRQPRVRKQILHFSKICIALSAFFL